MAHRTRIAVVNYPYDNDAEDADALLGRYVTLTDWSEAIASAGMTVTVVQRFHRARRFTRNGVEYVFCADGHDGDPRSRWWPRRLHQAVRSAQPDLVHVNGLNVPVQTWMLRRVLPSECALVVQDHGGTDASFGEGPEPSFREGPAKAGHYVRRHVKGDVRGAWLRRSVKGAAMRAADAFFFTAAVQAEAWQRVGLIKPDQRIYQVLESSTKMRPTDRSTARQESRMAGSPAILWVGRLNANKSPLTILDGFERSLSRLPEATLTMVFGTDDLLPAVEQRIRASSTLSARVRLAGAVPHERMAAFYCAADLFVLGSHHEGSGYALIEACACGVPPVVTDIPTFRVITDGGSVGALWPTDDAARLSDALVEVALRDGAGARQRVLDHFDSHLSWAAVARQASAAYADVVARPNR